MLNVSKNRYLPHAVVLLNAPEDGLIPDLVPFLKNFGMIEKEPTAYLCQNYSCDLPVHSAEELRERLSDI